MNYETMTPYLPGTDFSQEEADGVAGRSAVRTSAVDTELSAIQALTDAVINNIDLVLRSDGRLKDQLIDLHAFHPDVYAEFSANLTVLKTLGTSTSYGSDTGTADAIVATIAPKPESYFAGFAIWVKINATCTGGPVTANINGLGNTPVKQADGTTDPAIGELQAGGIAYLVHDGTSFQHINKTTTSASVSAHLADTGNPHSVTMAQVGVSAGDPTDANATRDKVFSNNDIKLVNDYRLAGHLPLAGGTISGAMLFQGANTFNGVSTFAERIVMSGKQVRQAYQATLASATTVDLSAALGNSVTITGTTTITGLGTVQAGTVVNILFAGALNFTHSAALDLPTNTTILTAAGDVAVMLSLGSGNWKCISYTKNDGVALLGGGRFPLETKTASDSVTIDFTSISSVFSKLEINFLQIVPQTDDVELHMLFDYGSGFITSGYRWQNQIISQTGTAVNQNASGGAFGGIIAETTATWGLGNATSETANGEILIYNPNNAGAYTQWIANFHYLNNVMFSSYAAAGAQETDGALSGIRFEMSSGNISSGAFALTGLL